MSKQFPNWTKREVLERTIDKPHDIYLMSGAKLLNVNIDNIHFDYRSGNISEILYTTLKGSNILPGKQGLLRGAAFSNFEGPSIKEGLGF